jgi:hypothetical protein
MAYHADAKCDPALPIDILLVSYCHLWRTRTAWRPGCTCRLPVKAPRLQPAAPGRRSRRRPPGTPTDRQTRTRARARSRSCCGQSVSVRLTGSGSASSGFGFRFLILGFVHGGVGQTGTARVRAGIALNGSKCAGRQLCQAGRQADRHLRQTGRRPRDGRTGNGWVDRSRRVENGKDRHKRHRHTDGSSPIARP